jgi:hypothetical protein
MREFIYRKLLWVAKLFKEKPTRVEIKSVEQLDEMIKNGFKLQRLELNTKIPPDYPDPLDDTLRSNALRVLSENACFNLQLYTIGDKDYPELLICIVTTEEYVRKAEEVLKKFSKDYID